MRTKVVKKSGSSEEERLIIDPPYCVFGLPSLAQSESIIFKVGALRKMMKGLGDNDSFRIEWFADRATEYSYFKKKK